jgi:voltage-gated potassium channel
MMNAERRARAAASFQRATELPLLVLSLILIPLIVLPAAISLPSPVERIVDALSWLIWAAFALELTVRTYLAERRLHYLLTHWYDVLIVLLPFLRPLRIVRAGRLLRLVAMTRVLGIGTRLLVTARLLSSRHGFQYAALAGVALFLACAVAVLLFEQRAGGNIDDLGTALWWAAVTVTTVGYGDAFPVTPEGRGVAVFLMLVGITLFSLLTANIAAFFVEGQAKRDRASLEEVLTALHQIEARLAELQQRLASTSAQGVQPAGELS